MKLLKLFSLIIISFLAMAVFNPIQAQETNAQDLSNVLAEFEADSIDAQDFNMEEPSVLPGQFQYNWQKFKENVGLFFTFDQEKKINKLEEISNRRLLEAKKLADTGTANAASRVEEALKNYQEAKQKIATKLVANPELQQTLLEKLDANQIKHEQILSTVTEKLRDKIPADQLTRLENIKKEDALNWYNTNSEDIQQRLENAIDNNNLGSKFKQLSNIATLQELGDILPENARTRIEAANTKAEEKLSERLQNINTTDQQKLEKYINNIKTTEIVKQKFISNLKDSTELPQAVKEKAASIFDNYSANMLQRFQNLDPSEQEKFLNQFENESRSHPANIKFLEDLNKIENNDRIKYLIEIQIEGVKAKIQGTTDPAKLKSLEQNLSENPVLRRQIQQRQSEIRNAPDPSPSIMPQR